MLPVCGDFALFVAMAEKEEYKVVTLCGQCFNYVIGDVVRSGGFAFG